MFIHLDDHESIHSKHRECCSIKNAGTGYRGYRGYGYRGYSGLFVDFDFQVLLGQVDAITPHANRRLEVRRPCHCLKCSREVEGG
jgi:hypothetical protein